MRLIDADALIKTLEKKHERFISITGSCNSYDDIEYAHRFAIKEIEKAPTVEVEKKDSTA